MKDQQVVHKNSIIFIISNKRVYYLRYKLLHNILLWTLSSKFVSINKHPLQHGESPPGLSHKIGSRHVLYRNTNLHTSNTTNNNKPNKTDQKHKSTTSPTHDLCVS